MIPTEIQCLLQLGSNFISLRITQKKDEILRIYKKHRK